MTFSIAALCPDSGRIALAVASSSPAVAARCAHVRAGVGAVASQNITDPRLGRQGLDLMALGASPAEALAVLRATGPHIRYRQLALLDRQGRTAAWSGEGTLGVHATAPGDGVVAAGNLLANAGVPQAIVDGYKAAVGSFGDRILAAMQAGLAAGGEAGPIRSVGMVVMAEVPWAVVDLRVDWHDEPIAELARLWEVWKPQAEAYVTRALDPREAPTFGVPGDR